MCGITALISPKGEIAAANLRAMTTVISHRGPDDEGYALFAGDNVSTLGGADTPQACYAADVPYAPQPWQETHDASVAFGHRRLAIVDVSAAGHQPMCDPSRSSWIVFNGEIYNWRELRDELSALGHVFRTQTDTEVILAALAQWGRAALPRFNGMFAFVHYDLRTQRLLAVRDRFGVKPLYWWRAPDGTLAFASEIKSFTALPGWRARLNGQAAYEFLNWGLSDHHDTTMFEGVRSLPPGMLIEAELSAFVNDPKPQAWYEIGQQRAVPADDAQATKVWRDLFFDAVNCRLRADVPVGTALSGGLDSSSIVCTASLLLRDGKGEAEQNAFSARSLDPALDEGAYMAAVVARTGVRHHNVWTEPDNLFETLPDLTWHMDEPFGSTSTFAEWAVFRMVGATPVKVTLDGHGADELLAGYRAFGGPYLAQLLRRGRFIAAAREAMAMRQKGFRAFDLAAQVVEDFSPAFLRLALRRFAGRSTPEPDWLDLERLGAQTTEPFEGDQHGGISGMSVSQLRGTSLPMQLHWNDRNSMAHSVESRAPFLDYRLVESTLALRDNLKLAQGVSKVVLRKALADVLPPEILARRDKMGFVTAEQMWVQRDRPQEFSAAASAAIARAGSIFRPHTLAWLEDMIAGRKPYRAALWRIISFGAWLERFEVEVP
jgi:asparagine synthase (glutamine-hydrolysing)